MLSEMLNKRKIDIVNAKQTGCQELMIVDFAHKIQPSWAHGILILILSFSLFLCRNNEKHLLKKKNFLLFSIPLFVYSATIIAACWALKFYSMEFSFHSLMIFE